MWNGLYMRQRVLHTVLPCTRVWKSLCMWTHVNSISLCQMEKREAIWHFGKLCQNHRAETAFGLLFCQLLQKCSSIKLNLCWVSLWTLCYHTLKSMLQIQDWLSCMHSQCLQKPKEIKKGTKNPIYVPGLYLTWKIF